MADAARCGRGARGLVAGHRGGGRRRAGERAAVGRRRPDGRDRRRPGQRSDPCARARCWRRRPERRRWPPWRASGRWPTGSGMPNAPRAFARTVVATDLDALLAGWQRLPAGWAGVTVAGDLADARGVVIRGRGDPPGGATARAHARRRELGSCGRGARDARSPMRSARHTQRPRPCGPRGASISPHARRTTRRSGWRALRVSALQAAEAAVKREAERAAALTAELAAPPRGEHGR